jgi:hypothetical protein
LLAAVVLSAADCAQAWSSDGVISGTDLEYSGLSVTKKGVSVRLTNTSGDDVKVSLKLTFYDVNGSSLGYSIFGLREIGARQQVEVSDNYLTGKWKPCRDSQRMEFLKMTYEPIYY